MGCAEKPPCSEEGLGQWPPHGMEDTPPGEAAAGEPLCWPARRLVGHAASREPGLSGSCVPPALGQGSPRLSPRCPQPVPPVAGELEARGEGAHTIPSTKVKGSLRTSRCPEAVGGVDGAH